RRHTRFSRDWSSDVCSSDLLSPLPSRGCVFAHHEGEEVERYGYAPTRARRLQNHALTLKRDGDAARRLRTRWRRDWIVALYRCVDEVCPVDSEAPRPRVQDRQLTIRLRRRKCVALCVRILDPGVNQSVQMLSSRLGLLIGNARVVCVEPVVDSHHFDKCTRRLDNLHFERGLVVLRPGRSAQERLNSKQNSGDKSVHLRPNFDLDGRSLPLSTS